MVPDDSLGAGDDGADEARERRRQERAREREQRRLKAEENRRWKRLHRLVPAAGSVVAVIFAVLAAVGVFSGGGAKHAAAPAGPAPKQLPRGGRTLLPGHMVVAYYGILGTTNILGHTHSPRADAAGVEKQAAAYAKLGLKVQPAFELVTTEASSDPGPHETYSEPLPPSTVQRYLTAAHRHKLLLILDFQPGRSAFLPQVKRYAKFLTDPSVGVALDPEWKLTGDETPGADIGSSSAAGINAVSTYLSALVKQDNLPQKLFVVHQFRPGELPDRGNIRLAPGLATVLQMDGTGSVAAKLADYRKIESFAHGFIPGFKVFLLKSQDPVRMTPAQVMRIRPRPQYVSYQ